MTVLATGERCLLIAMKVLHNLEKQGLDFDIVNARFIKPLDVDFLQNDVNEHVITMEDNVFNGGFGVLVTNELLRLKKDCKIKNFAYRDEFIKQGAVGALQSEYGVDWQEIKAYIKSVLA